MIIFCTFLFSYIFITFQFTDETVMSNSNSKGQYGQAEVLAHIVRANRRMKAIRRSQAYQEVKKMNADPITEEGSISSETKEANFEKRKSNFNRLKQKSEDEINKEEKYVFYIIYSIFVFVFYGENAYRFIINMIKQISMSYI